MDQMELKKKKNTESKQLVDTERTVFFKRTKERQKAEISLSLYSDYSDVSENQITEDAQKISWLIFRIRCNIMRLCDNIQQCCWIIFTTFWDHNRSSESCSHLLSQPLFIDTDSHTQAHTHTHTQCDIALKHGNGFLSTLWERRMCLVEMDGWKQGTNSAAL